MIRYYSKGTDFKPKFTTKINRWIKTVANSKGFFRITLNYVFCSDAQLLAMNREFLGHDYYTDIITFDTLDDQVIKKSSLSGDIFISVDTVSINSKTYNSSFEDELLRVMMHGVLHLMGYDDHTPEEENEMHRQEDSALEIYYGKTI